VALNSKIIKGGLNTFAEAIARAPKDVQQLRKMFLNNMMGMPLSHGTDAKNINSILKTGLRGPSFHMVNDQGWEIGNNTKFLEHTPLWEDLKIIHPDPELILGHGYVPLDKWNEMMGGSTKMLDQINLLRNPDYQSTLYRGLADDGYIEDPTGLAVLREQVVPAKQLKVVK
jgi:hypothetical protein